MVELRKVVAAIAPPLPRLRFGFAGLVITCVGRFIKFSGETPEMEYSYGMLAVPGY